MEAQRVDFLIAGVQKAGTGTLNAMLRRSPDIAMARGKEVHFFDDETIDWSAADYSAYHARFDWRGPARRRGEATPIYTFWPPAAGRIYRYHPQIRFVVSLRDPIRRAYSHWQMQFARQREPFDFEAAIEAEAPRLAEPLSRAHRVFSYVTRGFYTAQIERLRTFFPERNVKLIVAEDLFERPQSVIDDICGFLGIPAFTAAKLHVNKAAEMEFPSALSQKTIDRLREVYAEERRKFEALVGRWPKQWL